MPGGRYQVGDRIQLNDGDEEFWGTIIATPPNASGKLFDMRRDDHVKGNGVGRTWAVMVDNSWQKVVVHRRDGLLVHRALKAPDPPPAWVDLDEGEGDDSDG